MQRLIVVILLSSILTGCGILEPYVYRLAIFQGNIIEQEQIDKLKIGMTKPQVAFVLGTALAQDAFDSNRWEYTNVYRSRAGNSIIKKLVISFNKGKLKSVIGDFETDKVIEML